MKIAHVHEYSPHMFILNKTVVTLHEAINDKKYDLAKLLANEIKITALLLENELSRLK